jgi:hypothetical protein
MKAVPSLSTVARSIAKNARCPGIIPEEYTHWTDSHGRDVAVVEITIRIVLGMFLLKPTQKNRWLIVAVMAHVQQCLKFDAYGYGRLWNHGWYLDYA